MREQDGGADIRKLSRVSDSLSGTNRGQWYGKGARASTPPPANFVAAARSSGSTREICRIPRASGKNALIAAHDGPMAVHSVAQRRYSAGGFRRPLGRVRR